MSDVSPVVGRRGHKFENAFFSEKFDVQLFEFFAPQGRPI